MPVYVDTAQSTRKVQLKPWYGGVDDAKREFEDGAVSCCVAYLRVVENEVTEQLDNDRYVYFPDTADAGVYQIQSWKNLDLFQGEIPEKQERWSLLKATNLEEEKRWGAFGSYVRLPLQSPTSADSLTLKIDTTKFTPGTYQYTLISLDKLEEKLHLMSKYGLETPDPFLPLPYPHIEENLSVDAVYADLDFVHDPIDPGFNDSPIIAEGTLPLSGLHSITVNISFPDPESPDYPVSLLSMSDFILIIKP